MANNFDSNPIFIDTASDGKVFDRGSRFIVGIVVIASADTWSCILNESDGGARVFRADSSIANHRSVYWSPAKPIPLWGIYAQTLTDIQEVLIYTSS